MQLELKKPYDLNCFIDARLPVAHRRVAHFGTFQTLENGNLVYVTQRAHSLFGDRLELVVVTWDDPQKTLIQKVRVGHVD